MSGAGVALQPVTFAARSILPVGCDVLTVGKDSPRVVHLAALLPLSKAVIG